MPLIAIKNENEMDKETIPNGSLTIWDVGAGVEAYA
jgi:hypothetical protein